MAARVVESGTRKTAVCAAPDAHRVASPSAARYRWLLLTILALGGLSRAIVLVDYLAHNPTAAAPITDAAWYWNWAGRIAAGELIGKAPFTSAPLYPWLLGLERALGGGLKLLYLLQIAAGLATALLLAEICRRRFGQAAALAAAALFLLLQEPASAELRVLTSTLELLMVVSVWGLLVRLEARPSSWAAHLAGGAGLGLLCLAFAPALLLLPVVACWLVVRARPRLPAVGRAAALIVAAAVLIAPATLHNWLAAHEFLLVRAGAGLTLRQGNHPRSVGSYTPIPGVSALREKQYESAAKVYQRATGRNPTWTAVDRYFGQQVLSYWWSDPGRALELAGLKLYRTLTYQNYGDIYQPRAEIKCGLTRALWLAPLPMPLLIALALVGAATWLGRPLHYAPELMLLFVPLCITAVFFYSPRYRLPAAPILAGAAAVAVVRAWDWRRQRAVLVGVAVMLAASLTLRAVNIAHGRDYLDFGSIYSALAAAYDQQGRTDESIAMARKALQLTPDDVDGHMSLAHRLRASGRLDEAASEYLRAVQFAPDDAALLNRTFSTLMQARRFAEAEALATAAVQRHPDDVASLTALAEAKHARGDLRGAEECVARALSRAPDNVRLRLLHADMLMNQQHLSEAQAELERILEFSPADCGALWRLGQLAGRAGRLEDARLNLEHAVAVCPDNASAWHDLGVVNLRANRLPDARDCLHKALQLDPALHASQQVLEQIDALTTQPAQDGP